ncbi:DsbA family protein [Dichotomicrobium thermohalophilum]|uniref:Protein-disulfide isomerase n=1 Tax=Dichotomicrobium thermohalophilum TaxID=933063 RepID=A0A397Q9B5_9HYPH|nr:DsbA family protein [Dichotomicrobium thermohalophilum]RIA56405.1 protein-disulfide isomerase [Dichotomicrobium thermohalophilum]
MIGSRMLLGGAPRVVSTLAVLGFAAFLTACAGGQVSQPQTLEAMIAAGGGPTLEMLKKPGPLPERTMGNPDAPVTVIEYASLTCPYCRRFHADVFPRFKRNYIDTGKVHFIYREFPIGRSAGTAAIAARCVADEHYFAANWKFLAEQRKWVSQEVRPDAIYKIVQEFGLDRAAFDTCLENQTIIDGLKQVKERGRDLGVSATPTIFVNTEKRRGGVSYEDLVKLIEAANEAAPQG